MNRSLRLTAALAPIAGLLALAPTTAHASTDELITRQAQLAADGAAAPLQSERITSTSQNPGQSVRQAVSGDNK